MAAPYIPPITPELWIKNLIQAVGDIANKERQEKRWMAKDAFAWENPVELICVIDDCVFDGFLEKYEATFSEEQRVAAFSFRDDFNYYCDSTPGSLDPAQVLTDARWAALREKASAFVLAFSGKWPPSHMPVAPN